MDENTCPDCGSANAVSKAVAWDAAAATPQRVLEELARLKEIEETSQALVEREASYAEGMRVVSSPLYEKLRAAVLQDRGKP